jgi:hypothetical protein
MAPNPTGRSPPDGEAAHGGEGFREEGSGGDLDPQDSMPKLRISGEALKKLVSQVSAFQKPTANTVSSICPLFFIEQQTHTPAWFALLCVLTSL